MNEALARLNGLQPSDFSPMNDEKKRIAELEEQVRKLTALIENAGKTEKKSDEE